MKDEFAKIEWLKRRFHLTGDDVSEMPVSVGIGDDAAVVDLGGRRTVVTIDTQIEGVHFLHDFLSFQELGVRAVTAATCDVWAMGATPRAAVVALGLPSSMSQGAFEALIDGIAEASQLTRARIIGGNLSGADALSVTTTVLGSLSGAVVTRAGARPGDEVYVTGVVGAAALGLMLLNAGATNERHADGFVARWRRPPNHSAVAEPLGQVATAAIDVSDGLVQDLGHLCEASGVGAAIEAGALPLADHHAELCAKLGRDALEPALTGGEDYELLFTVPAGTDAIVPATRVGAIVEGEGVRVMDQDGRPMVIERTGFRHFS